MKDLPTPSAASNPRPRLRRDATRPQIEIAE